ncbi:zinc finger protein 513a isoform X1 [Hypomesus transpacificus]|uniref:zinc finger protein 513a isoform X1 n=2 Tax=Hypomesus transpacificus TaxID=137520 RepID=UPI001F081271|nr:zinc finger protein 513a isoform X1 [Hypomesus transpacificus]
MPRRKQQNPQPVKLDSEDGVAIETPGSINLETDFLLGNDLEFGDPDDENKIPDLDKYSDAEAADIGFSVFPLGDEESPAYSQLSMESDTDDPRAASDHQRDEEAAGAAFPPYLSCRGCGQLRDEPLGPGIDLVGPYCLRCCKAGREAKGGGDYSTPSFGLASGMSTGGESQEGDSDGGGGGTANASLASEDGQSKLSSCHLCGFSSRYANHVKRHMKTHNGEKPYNCPLCTYASAQLVNLQRHLRIHTGEKPYKCDSCTFACSSLGNLKRHQRMHTPTATGAEQEVPRPISSHNSLKRPWIGQRAKEEEPCVSVDEHVRPDLHLHGGVQNHTYLSAFDSPRGAPPERPQTSLFDVTGNGSGHNSIKRSRIGQRARGEGHGASSEETVRPDLNTHGTDHKDGYLLAFDGGLRGGPPPLLQRPPPPLLETASGGGDSRGGAGAGAGGDTLPPLLFPYTCRLCGVVLEDEDGSSAQICAKCTLEMLTKDSSSPSSPGERSDKVYTCPVCPFLTHYPNHLARHMKTHSGEKPYKCPQCDYASAHFDNLKRHHRVHTGEKPYKCHLCDYACGNLANLKRHQRVHSGVKPFQCPLCSYSCNQSMNLKRHMLRHTGEKPYKCQDCGYTTGHWDNYKRHQKKHGLATEGWVKVQAPGHEEDEEEDEDEGMGVPSERKDGGVNMQYVLGRGGGVLPHT